MKHYGFSVVKTEFSRTDYRYVKENGEKEGCRPYKYSCCVDTALAKKSELKSCPSTKKDRNEKFDKCLVDIEYYPNKPPPTRRRRRRRRDRVLHVPQTNILKNVPGLN